MQTKQQKKQQDIYKKYGLNWGEYLDLICNGCNICGSKVRLAVDHRHVKNYKKLKPEEKRKEVRGCLCFRHNKFTVGGLEIDKESRKTLNKIIEYFTKFKMKGDQ
jgi:hypothetical protein